MSIALTAMHASPSLDVRPPDDMIGRLLRLLTGDLEPKSGPLFMRIYSDSGEVGDDAPEVRVERGSSTCLAAEPWLPCHLLFFVYINSAS